MQRLAPFARISALALVALLAFSGCRSRKESSSADSTSPRAPREARERSQAEGLEALAANATEIRRRVMAADIEVPGTEERVHLVDGRGQGPGSPPAWNVEARNVVGVVRGERGLDVFVDLAIHHPLKPADCYLALLYMDSLEAVYTSAAPMGEGAQVVEVKAENAKGDVYDLAVDYLGRAPQGDLSSSPSEAKKKTIVVAHHALGGKVMAPSSPH